jgi:thiol-disulfide isomerase/thioredoxin
LSLKAQSSKGKTLLLAFSIEHFDIHLPAVGRNLGFNSFLMKLRLFGWFLILSLCMGLVFLFPHCGKERKEYTSPLAPDFTLRSLSGQEVTLSKMKGEVVLLDFWATWCSPCRESIPHLIQLYKTYQKKGLVLIGVNMDRGNIDNVRHFITSMDIPYPIVITSSDVERNYGVTSLPTTILIDKKGRIRQNIRGFTSEIAKQMTTKVQDLISEKP